MEKVTKNGPLSSFLEVCATLEECRDSRGVRYPCGLLVLSISLAICARNFTQRSKQEWIEAHWKWIVRLWLKISELKPNSKGTPSQSCICRFLHVLDPKLLSEALTKSERDTLVEELEIFQRSEKARIKKRKVNNNNKKNQVLKKIPQYCLDGKSRKGCVSKKTGRTEIDFTLYNPDTKKVLVHRTLKDKQGEQTAALAILRKEAKTLPRGVFSGDAAIVSPNSTELVIRGGHSYILAIKGNAGNVFKKIKEFDWENIEQVDKVYDKGHGREEWRMIKKVKIREIGTEHFAKYKSADTVYQVSSRIYHNKDRKWRTNSRYFLADEKLSRWHRSTILHYIRGHWEQEVYHHYKDVTLKEDPCKVKRKNGSRVLGILRSFVVKVGIKLYSSPQIFIDKFSANPKLIMKKLESI